MVDVKKEEKSKNAFEMEITIEESRVQEALESVYRELNVKTQVPGFRKGRVPRSILRRFVDPEYVRDALVQKLVPAVYREVLEKEQVDIIGEPNLEIVQAEENRPLIFTIRFLTRPEITLPDPGTIEVRRYTIEIRETDIEKEMTRLQESSGTWIEKTEAVINEGDFVQVALDGEKMGLIAGDTEHQNDPMLNRLVLGMKPGEEKTVAMSGETDQQEKTLEIHRVQELRLPEMDEEFIQRFGEDITSLEELKEKIKEHLEHMAQAMVNKRFNREAMVAFCRKAEVEVPEDLIGEGKKQRMNRFLEELKKDGMTIERYAELTGIDQKAVEESFRKMAAWDLKKALVFGEFSRQQGISISGEDLDSEIEKMAVRVGKSAQELRKLLEKNGRIETVEDELYNRKVMEEIAHLVGEKMIEEPINLDQWKTLEDPEEGMFS